MTDDIHPFFSADAIAAPRLALVLGSGGVRSAAAIGMARVLARQGLMPSLIVGCSSGALFGACLALGWSPQEVLARSRALWSSELTRQRRWRAYAQLVAPRLAGFGPHFSLRDGRLMGARIAQAFGEARIEHLPVPLRIVATDAARGTRCVLDQGPLAASVQASMAVPLLFPPVQINGRRLVDGVISDPLPIAAAADCEVVLTLGFRGGLPRRIDRIGRLFGLVSTTVLNNLMEARMDAARWSGQHIVEVVPRIDPRTALWDTTAMALIADRGEEAAEAAMPALLAAWQAACRARALPSAAAAPDPNRAGTSRWSRPTGELRCT